MINKIIKKHEQLKLKVSNSKIILKYLFYLTFIPFIINSKRIFGLFIYFIINIIYIITLFSRLFYPKYYINQDEIWNLDLVIGFIIYNFLIYQHLTSNLFLIPNNNSLPITSFDVKNELFLEELDISNLSNIITFGFYILYICYWIYYAIYMFYSHPEKNIFIQLGNMVMFCGWYLFFFTISLIYYYICVKLLKRYSSIRENLLKKTKKDKLNLEQFMEIYYIEYKKTKIFSLKWNFIIYFGFILLTFHIPVDLISILVGKKYYDIPGLIIKILSLLWYVKCICELNNLDTIVIKYLYKHKIFTKEQISTIQDHVETRPLGISFYGLKLNGNFFIQILIIFINFIIPILYGLFVNNIL